MLRNIRLGPSYSPLTQECDMAIEKPIGRLRTSHSLGVKLGLPYETKVELGK
ncbi:hypothetical protein D3C72_1959030 [compost metagenome]